MDTPPLPHRLEVHGRFIVTRGDDRVVVTAEGRRFTIDCRSTDTLKALLSQANKLRSMKLPPMPGPRKSTPRTPDPANYAGSAAGSADDPAASADRRPDPLERLGLDIVFQLKGTTIARLGESAEPGWLEQTLGLKGVDVKPGALLKAWFKRGTS